MDALTYALAAREGLAINLDIREEALKLHPLEYARAARHAIEVAGTGELLTHCLEWPKSLQALKVAGRYKPDRNDARGLGHLAYAVLMT